MKRPQWITAGTALILTFVIFAATQKQILGNPKVKKAPAASPAVQEVSYSTDSVLSKAKEGLPPEVLTRLDLLEHSISRGDVKNQQLQVYHQLAHYWGDSAHKFEPYAWYTAESARLENSEKSLTFAAHLFLNNLTSEENPDIKKWEAFQAKDLFERSLKLNPENDSSKVGLGA
ncbi:MAG TPA: hypothetical protein VFQ58_01850, partial [Flavisolibacter sp.]|nr:hypothetical protein [Flavisolibacter sp.]